MSENWTSLEEAYLPQAGASSGNSFTAYAGPSDHQRK